MASLASDTRRGRVVLFGGWHTAGLGILGDTWEWDGVDWTQQAPARSPSARRWPAMAFDAQDGVTVLFGGLDASVTNVADTWIWNGVDWTQRPTPASPTVRSEHTMVATRGRAIVFGGNGGNLFSLRRGDTWEHDGGTWILTASTGPSARVRHGMVHDVARGNSVLFGGSVSGPSTFLALGETWVFTNNSASATTFGNGCAGSAGVPSLAVPAPPVLGSTLVVSITGMQPAGGAGFVALGFSSSSWLAASLPLSLATFGMPGCSVFVSVDATGMFSHGNGSAAWSLPIPLAPTLAGLRGYWQALVLDSGAGNPAGAVVTNAAATVMGL
jgi:hypothetical protein